jgi:ribosomal protein S18 acetylase RimI-like enzyme
MTAIIYRRARPGEGAEIARMVRQLAVDIGATTVPKVTAKHIEELAFGPTPVLHVHMAEANGVAVGTIVNEVIYSTWRGGLGLYVCDLHVEAPWRGLGIGLGLLRAARADHPRAIFFKLEVTDDNEAARRFYRRHGFETPHDERTFVLDGEAYARL